MKNFKKNKAFVKPSGAKHSKFFIHVGQGRNTNNAAENKENQAIISQKNNKLSSICHPKQKMGDKNGEYLYE